MDQPTFFFYDLETTGTDPRRDRILQFAGRRTTLELDPIGEPINVLVKLADDVLPSPQATFITGLTPQATRRDGISEAELASMLRNEVLIPGTITTGFNSVRFDDNFIRYLFFRCFSDPYAWTYANGRSRWDLLDVVRLCRALRPEGIIWPVGEDGRPTNRLEHLAAANGLDHIKAHDALSDVDALIGVTRLIRAKQPKFFDYLLKMRDKKAVAGLVSTEDPQAFVYASGRYSMDLHHTTVVFPIGKGKNSSIIVYDLRQDPNAYAGKSVEELKASRFATREQRAADGFLPLPVKELVPNKCPAVAPLATLTPEAEARISLSIATALKHLAQLETSELIPRLKEALRGDDFPAAIDVDASLYDSFIPDSDKPAMQDICTATPEQLARLHPQFRDPRLGPLLVRYKGRNFPDSLNTEDRLTWETYRTQRLQADLPLFVAELEGLAVSATPAQISLLEDLKLWAESIMPLETSE